VGMKQSVVGLQEQLRQQKARERILRMGTQDIQYAVGDFVLVSRSTRKQEKLQLQWIGPFQVIDAESPWVYKVRSIADGTEKAVHASRLRFYADEALDITEEVKEQFIRDSKGFEVDKITGIRVDPVTNSYQFKIHWWGLEDSDDEWQSFEEIKDELADMILEYIHTNDTPETRSFKQRRKLMDALQSS